jgi:outer membrane protein TolC
MYKYFLFLFISLVISAQDKENKFSLEEAIAYALKNNSQVINANRDITLAKLKKWETTAAGLPQINAGIDYQNNIVIQKSVVPGEFFGGEPGSFTEVAFGTKHVGVGRASLTQLLFDGSYLVALEASKAYLEFFSNNKIKTDNDLKLVIVKSYSSILLLDESIKILEKNKKTLDKNLFEAKETFKNGFIEEENVEQLTITLSTIQNQLNNNNRIRSIALSMLKIQMGMNIEDNLFLTDILEDLVKKQALTNTTNQDFNVSQNIDYIIGQNNVEKNRLLHKLEKSKYLPTLGLALNTGYNAFSNDFSFFNSSQRYLNFTNLAVSLNVPIFSSFMRRSRTDQAKIEHDKSKDMLNDIERMLKLDYQKLTSEYEYCLEELNTNKNNLKLAERIENKQQIKFKEGLSTSFEFSEAQRQLYSAQQYYLQSLVNLVNKKAELDKLTNQL